MAMQKTEPDVISVCKTNEYSPLNNAARMLAVAFQRYTVHNYAERIDGST